jgi:hypothetical protein
MKITKKQLKKVREAVQRELEVEQGMQDGRMCTKVHKEKSEEDYIEEALDEFYEEEEEEIAVREIVKSPWRN